MAETEGFEPSVPHSQHAGLANRWFQPLTHVSGLRQQARPIAGVGGSCKRVWAVDRTGQVDSFGRETEPSRRGPVAGRPLDSV